MRKKSGSAGFFLRNMVAAILFVVSFGAHAQDIRVHGGFLSDSLKIGEQTAFYLSAHYPSDQHILFPDSTFRFFPFEYEKKEYFPTESEDGISVDSAVYYLTTFEVDRTQFLDLPVYLVQPQDCTIYISSRDSVLITQMVASVPDSLTADKLPLKMNTAYHEVDFQFNYWILIIVLTVLVIIAAVIWIFFGGRIRQYYTTRRLERNHRQFVSQYDRILAQLQSAFSAMTAESALSTWKKYMEQLESRPYTKLTTKETIMLIHDEDLRNNLRAADGAVYGHNTRVLHSFENLRSFADQRFSKKLEEVKHGK